MFWIERGVFITYNLEKEKYKILGDTETSPPMAGTNKGVRHHPLNP